MGTYDTYFGAARGLVRTAGVPRLYAGLAPYLFRAGPGAAIQFAAFGELKKLLDAPPPVVIIRLCCLRRAEGEGEPRGGVDNKDG